jgi:hypothetical protein
MQQTATKRRRRRIEDDEAGPRCRKQGDVDGDYVEQQLRLGPGGSGD